MAPAGTGSADGASLEEQIIANLAEADTTPGVSPYGTKEPEGVDRMVHEAIASTASTTMGAVSTLSERES